MSDAASNSNRARLVLLLLVILNVLNIVDRSLISSFGPQIIQDLNLTDTQFGLLTGLVFVFFYSVVGLFVGRLADVVHRPRLIAAGLLLWSALTVASGAARNFVQIGMARLVVGVGEACLTPASMSMLADLFPQEKRGMASSIYYLGVPLGGGVSLVAAGVLGPLIGWRNCFYVIGALGIMLVPVLWLLRDPERGVHDDMTSESDLDASNFRESLAQVWQLIRRYPALFWTMMGGLFMQLSIGSAQFAQVWLVRERGFEASDIALTYGLLFIFFGTLGSLFSGGLSDWYQRHYAGGRTRFLGWVLLVLLPLGIVYRFVEPGSLLFYTGMVAGIIGFMATFGPMFSTVQDIAPARLRGVSVALLLLAMNLLGLGLGAVTTGILSDVLRTAGLAEPLTWSLVTIDVITLMTIVSFFMASVYWKRDHENRAKAQ